MTKKLIITLLIANLQLQVGNAQTIARSSISTNGGTLTGGGNQITFSIGQIVIPTLTAGGSMITQGFQQPGEQIRTGSLPDSVCAGDSLFIPMTAIDIAAGNTFISQLSDATGSFAAPVTIGTASGQSLPILATLIPANTLPGNGYRIRVLASSPTVSSPASEVFTAQICILSVNVKFFIQGYYVGAGQMTSVLVNSGVGTDPTECDSVIIQLHDAQSPSNLLASTQTILHTDGTAMAEFPGNLGGTSCWISVKSKNTIETWSKTPLTINNNMIVDFTTP